MQMTRLTAGMGIALLISAAFMFTGCETDPENVSFYDISVMPGIQNGSITVDQTSATEGAAITINVAPADGYQLKAGSLIVQRTNGANVPISGSGDVYTFAMPPEDVTVSGEFEIIDSASPIQSYTVSITAAANGVVTANPSSATAGATITLTITPDTGYQLASLSVTQTDGSDVTVSATNTFSMPASNVTVSSRFELTRYSVTVQSGIQNGVISANPASALQGATVTLTITPAGGYQLKAGSLSVKQANGTNVTLSATNTFTMPDANVTVYGEFELLPNTIAVHFEIPGAQTIDLSKNTNNDIQQGSSQVITITVGGAYDSYYWYYNGEVKASGPYSNTFTMYGSNFNRVGLDTITVVAYKNGIPYSQYVTFRVVE